MSNHSADNRRIARNTLYLYIRMGVVMLISLYTTRVILRVLGVEDYGVYKVVGGFVSMFGVLNTTLTSGINRFYNFELGKEGGGNITRVYNTAIGIQIVIALVVLVLIETVGLWYVNSIMVFPPERLRVVNWLFQFSVISMMIIILQAPYSSAVLAYEKMDFFAFVSIADAILKLAICYIIRCFGEDKLFTYGWMVMLISFINFAMYYLYSKVHFKQLRFDFHIDKQLFKSMLSFSGWSMLNPISYTARNQGCNMVLNYFMGPLLNAAHGVSSQVSNAVDQMSRNFVVSFRPQIIQSYSSGEHARTKRLMYSMSKISFLLHALFVIPIIFEINNLLELWLGKDFIPEYAASFTCWILAIKWINSLNPPITNVMAATGKIKKINICTACIVVSIVPITIVLLKAGYPPTSMYIAMLVLTLINQYACLRIICSTFTEVTMRDYFKEIVLPCVELSIVALILPSLSCVFIEPSLGRLLLTCCLSVISVVAATAFYLNKEEKLLVKSMISAVLRRIRH